VEAREGRPGGKANIAVHIERLVLDGVDLHARNGDLLGATVEAELARMLAEGGLQGELMAGGATYRVAGGTISLPATGDPATWGRHIAGAVYNGIGAEHTGGK
jgi:hypothetical protein